MSAQPNLLLLGRISDNDGEFSEEVNGRVMFIAMRPEVSEPAKAPQQESVPGSAQTPNN